MKYYTNLILTVIALLLAFNIFGTHDFIPAPSAIFLDKKIGKVYIVNSGVLTEIDLLSGKRLVKAIKEEIPNFVPDNPNAVPITSPRTDKSVLDNLPDQQAPLDSFTPINNTPIK